MYPLTRLRKLRPEGTAYVSWYTYRLADHDGVARFLVPNGTARVRIGGAWVPEGVSIAAARPDRPYVVHWWESGGRTGFYVDAAREIRIESGLISYVDLYLDLACDDGSWKLLDEEELAQASPEDARLARSAIAEVRALIAAGDPLFQQGGDMWAVPQDALSLRPRRARGV